MKLQSLRNSAKKGFMFFLPWRYGLSWKPLNPCYPSQNITKNAETHPPTKREVIIEEPYVCFKTYKLISESYFYIFYLTSKASY